MFRPSPLVLTLSLLAMSCACGSSAQVPDRPPVSTNQTTKAFPPEAELLGLIKARVEGKRATGIVLAVREADGSHTIVSYGDAGAGALPLGPKSVFEIGSITKVFTGILLADMSLRGVLKLEDPISLHAHKGVTIPSLGTTPIRLLDLSTHRSGLPRLPANMLPADGTNPYADYSVQQLHTFLSGHSLQREVGAKYEYSNLGTGLLGHLLAAKHGSSWEDLVKQRILLPLGMDMTAVTLGVAMQEHLVRGHDLEGKVVSNWDLPTLAGAGALRSNAEDMLRFLDANLSDESSPLQQAMQLSHQPQAKMGPKSKIGLNWIIAEAGQHSIVTHTGGTGGYRSFIGFDAERKVGVILLENSTHGAEDIGMHLLDASLPLKESAKERKEVAVNPATLATYVGIYQLTSDFHLHVTLDSGALFTQATGQAKVPIFADSPSSFFLKVVDAQLTFARNAAGHVNRAILHQNGADQLAYRLKGEAAAKAIESVVGRQRTEVPLELDLLKEYVGRYDFTPTFHLNISIRAGKLIAKASGQPEIAILAEARDRFFANGVDAQITFVRDSSGTVHELLLHQSGFDQSATKVD